MAWNVDQVYKYLQYQTRKNQAAGISDTDLFNAWNSEQSAYMSDLLGRWQKLSSSKEGSTTGLIENETILGKLAPFTLSVPITITGGLGPKPPDFSFTMALRINGKKVFQVDPDEIWAVEEDVIDPPSDGDQSYYYTEYGGNFQFLPNDVQAAQLDYIQQVPDIKWNFTFDSDGREVYTATGSVNPAWDQLSIIEITRRCLNTLGVSFKDQDFAAFGKSNIQTGN